MKVGICCAGIGHGAAADFIRASAKAAEEGGFSIFWLPDHVVFFEAYRSQYSYGDFHEDSPVADPYTAFIEAIIGMTWAAAATTKIGVGTSVLILPQRNPVVLAKQLASLDALSGGRLTLGVGVGWSVEEYEAVNADWPGRGKRMDEYIAVMRTLWRDKAAAFDGDTVAFQRACLNPKPLRGDVPILMGGESEAALKRIARVGDGWIPAKLPVEEAAERIAHLKRMTREHGRDPDALRILSPMSETSKMEDLKRFREAGVTEFYLGVYPPEKPMSEAQVRSRIVELGERFVAPLSDW